MQQLRGFVFIRRNKDRIAAHCIVVARCCHLNWQGNTIGRFTLQAIASELVRVTQLVQLIPI
ncbi:hypothetical protein EN41_05190 [Agrobacterium tumefaciens]|nr:hypothetical protein EN41_05190 [Agrobacterium tumefaciens]UVY99442.1 hypothetical protein K4M20_00169 [Agrobacterium fabrum]